MQGTNIYKTTYDHNKWMVLRFDFSKLQLADPATVVQDFRSGIEQQIRTFVAKYNIEELPNTSINLNILLDHLREEGHQVSLSHCSFHSQVRILIDEYDYWYLKLEDK